MITPRSAGPTLRRRNAFYLRCPEERREQRMVDDSEKFGNERFNYPRSTARAKLASATMRTPEIAEIARLIQSARQRARSPVA
jgi:hypothetical protein